MLVCGLFAQNDYSSTKKFGVENLPVRETRQFGIMGNLGWNGLSGFGLTANTYLNTKMSIDGGLGLSSTGIKFGMRFNYLMLEKNFTPLLGLGFMYTTGFANSLNSVDDNNPYTFEINASPFAQITTGFEYLSNGGFIVKLNISYAILLSSGKNYTIISGTPTSNNIRAMDMAYGSGIVMEFGIGYIWHN